MLDWPQARDVALRQVEVPRVRITSGPAAEPVSLSDLKAHIRVYHTRDDSLITALGLVARATIEKMAGRSLITQTLVYVRDEFPRYPEEPIVIPRPPLASVTSLTYKNDLGVTSTLDPSTYTVDTESHPGRIVNNPGQSWPQVDLWSVNAITITCVAGYGLAGTNVPPGLLLAIKMLVGAWYDLREGVAIVQGGSPIVVPEGVRTLVLRDAVIGFGG